MKRTVKQFLVGATFGILVSTFIARGDFLLPLYEIAMEMTVILLAIALFLALMSFVKLAQLKKLSAQQLSGEEEDLQAENLYKLHSDASLASNISLIIGLAAACISVVTQQTILLQVWTIPVILLAVFSVPYVGNAVQYVYPHRDMPSFNDKQYTKKLFELSDEGERHIMLQGLYSAFSLTNILLLSSLLLFMFYSVASGESQLFAIVIITIILIVTNTQYILKVRNR